MWNGTLTKTYNLDDPNSYKTLIFNSLYCFTTRVVHAWITVTWGKGI